jgi:hypothetical protein
MGAVCGCGNESRDISSFWRGLALRKITFKTYCKIYEDNKMKWMNYCEDTRKIDLDKCNELSKLLVNDDFSKNENKIFIEILNEFINSQSGKLTFFTCLSFFTKLSGNDFASSLSDYNKKPTTNQTYIESLRSSESAENFEIVSYSLLEMAIKKKEHDDVTKLFIQLVSEFAVPFVYFAKKDRDEKLLVFSKENREKLFKQLKSFNSQKFYGYLFHEDNFALIYDDLVRIHTMSQAYSVDELVKVRTTANVGKSRFGDTPTPENCDAAVAN